jgi:glycosyltransferase involved in cell wall biosynthesis
VLAEQRVDIDALRFRIVGHIDGHYSLSIVNRGLAIALDRGPGSVVVNHYHGGRIVGVPNDLSADQRRLIEPMMQAWDRSAADDGDRISICHHYPLISDERPARLKLAFFFWEESVVPSSHVEFLNSNFAAVLVATEFVRKVLRDSGCKLPIKVAPLGVDQIIDAADKIASHGPADANRFRFLHVSSAFPRKGVDVLLSAYFSEFSADELVELVIKTSPNIHNNLADQIERLRHHHRNPPRVVVDERPLDEGELAQLYRTANAVVLPTRGEGFNLPAAEALALGLPVISTAYGGQSDFLTEDTGWRLDFDFAPSQSHLSSDESLWLEPRASDLREIMRRFVDRGTRAKLREEAFARAKIGQKLVRSIYRWSHTGVMVRAYASELLSNLPRDKPAPIRVALISSWATKCGVAEYSRMLFELFERERFEFSYFCDTRTAAAEHIYPLFSLGLPDSFALCCETVIARRFDAIVIQHQQSLFDIFAAAPHIARLQRRAPVFMTLHATDFLRHADPREVAFLVSVLRGIERLVVHTLADQSNLKEIGLVGNVLIIPHGIPAPRLSDIDDIASRRQRLSHDLRDGRHSTVPRALAQILSDRLLTGNFWVGTFGFLLPHKGLCELVEAVRILHDAGHTGLRVLMLCATLDQRSEPFAEELQKAIVKNRLETAVVLMRDYIATTDVFAMLNAMDLVTYTYSKTAESVSGAVRSGVAAERPILTTPLLIFQELRSFAFTTKDVDSQSIAEAMAPLLADRVHLESRLDTQRQWVRERNWSRISGRFSNMIEGVVAERRLAEPTQRQDTPMRQATRDDRGDPDALPICPPGVRQPVTGRSMSWMARIYCLTRSIDTSSFGSNLSQASTAVVWNESELALRRIDAPVNEPLHLAQPDRFCLSESILLVPADGLRAIPAVQWTALFLYASRHRIRAILEHDGRPDLNAISILADTIVTPDADTTISVQKAVDRHNDMHAPQVWSGLDLPITSVLRDSLTLRSLSLLEAEGNKSPLIRAIRCEAPRFNCRDGRAVVRFDETDGSTLGWIVASGRLDEIRFDLHLGSRNRKQERLAVLMDDEAVEHWSEDNAVTARLIERATAIIFETSAGYRRFFEAASRRDRSISLLRRRAYLVEADPNEAPNDLLDRLARILRQIAPVRLTEVIQNFPILKSPPFPRGDKKLSVCVSTYNRAAWLRVTLPLLAQDIASHADVEFLVVDNTSTDETPSVLEDLAPVLGFRWVRNASNVGMLGNLAVTSRAARGDYVWILGDDDLVRRGTVAKVLDALKRHPDTELVYLNYAYTHFDKPSDVDNIENIITAAIPIAPDTPSGFFTTIKTFAANNENLFTAIYACVFRRDHAIAAYTQYTGGPPFSTLATCIPTTKYVLEHMMDRPGYWIGAHQIVVNMNVSWMRYAAVWHMERLPEAFDLAEAMGADQHDLMRYRKSNLTQAIHFMSEGYGQDNDIRALLSMCRYIETAKRVAELSSYSNELFARYDRATRSQSTRRDELPTATLRSTYGLV